MSAPRSALVVGVDGLIGRALASGLIASGIRVIATTRRARLASGPSFELDLAAPALPELPRTDVAFICAAISRFADCDADPATAHRVNVAAPLQIARQSLARGTRIVLLSSNAVFDGTDPAPDEAATTSPQSTYGMLKAEAEAGLLRLSAATPNALAIIRMTKVLGVEAPLLRDWRKAWADGRTVNAFTDLTLAPISLAYTVAALLSVAQQPAGGVFHLSGAEETTYSRLATLLADADGIAHTLIHQTARQPAGSSVGHNRLSMARTTQVLGLAPQSLAAVIAGLR